MKKDKLYIKNKKSNWNYELLDKYSCGIMLVGSEVKSIFVNGCSINEAYCYVDNGEVFIKGMNIPPYNFANDQNHDSTRIRKLLLNKNEIEKIAVELKNKGITLIPVYMFENDRGKIKIEIAIARGKKEHDKRDDIKIKDLDRELKRENII